MIEIGLIDTSDEVLMDKWYDHVDSVFTSENRSYFVNHQEFDPRPSVIFAVKEINGDEVEILSTVKVFTRYVSIGGISFTVGGIGEVSTKEKARGNGYASTLLRMAIEFMEKNDFDISLLGTGSMSFYERLDWRSIHYYASTTVFQRNDSLDDHIEINRINVDNWESVPENIQILHSKFNEKHNGWEIRENEFWNRWSLQEIKKTNHFYIATIDQKLVAYSAFGYIRPDAATLRDFAFEEGLPEDFLLLFAQKLMTEDPYKMVNELSIQHPAVLKQYPSTETWNNEGLMYRIINLSDTKHQHLLSSLHLQSLLDTNQWASWSLDSF